MKTIIALLLAGAVTANGTTDLEDKLPLPSKPLLWGDVNFIHTTDIHGEPCHDERSWSLSVITLCILRLAFRTSACEFTRKASAMRGASADS